MKWICNPITTFSLNWSQVPEALPEHLHQLYLEFNSIDSLPEGFLGQFTRLQYVRIAHNQLTDKGIPANTFNVTGLVELDLSFNKLERIPLVSTTLQHLYLQANQIKGNIKYKCFLKHLYKHTHNNCKSNSWRFWKGLNTINQLLSLNNWVLHKTVLLCAPHTGLWMGRC